MLMLIDYDNVDEAPRRMGVEHVVRKCFSLADKANISLTRARARLYGGWYEGGRLTRSAQDLGAAIRACTPLRVARDGTNDIVLVDVELAVSILAAPRVTVTNTLRRKGYPRRMQCEGQPWLMCADKANCPIAVVHSFIDNDICTNTACAVSPSDILFKAEQKVVDTMMVADLIFAAQTGEPWISVVTRDDDIWPGLSIAAGHAQMISHVSTTASNRAPQYYSSLRTPPYMRIDWS